MIQTTYKD